MFVLSLLRACSNRIGLRIEVGQVPARCRQPDSRMFIPDFSSALRLCTFYHHALWLLLFSHVSNALPTSVSLTDPTNTFTSRWNQRGIRRRTESVWM